MEASDYMLKHNQFVRVSCSGFNIERLFWSEGVPVVTTDSCKVGQYDDYVMHIKLSKPLGSPKLHSSDFEMMILQSDLALFCEKLDIETARVDRFTKISDYSSIRVEIEFKDALAPYYTPKVQQRLLKPIATHVRGIQDLKILGPIDSTFKQTLVDEVAMPRWTDPDSLLQEIDTDFQVGELHWEQNEHTEAAKSWTRALGTLERIRWSSSWFGLNESGGEEFSKKVADLYYSLNLLYAKYLQLDMARNPTDVSLLQRNGRHAVEHLNKCGNASVLFAPNATPIWIPNTRQATTMLCLRARCARLMRDYDNMFKARHFIQLARSRAPHDLVIAEEAVAVLSWVWNNEQAWLSWQIRRAEEACKAMAKHAAMMVNETERLMNVLTEYASRDT